MSWRLSCQFIILLGFVKMACCGRTPRYDGCSAANFNEVEITHVHLDWKLDFEQKQIRGTAKYTLTGIADQPVDHVVFDGSGLQIMATKINGKDTNHTVKDAAFKPFGQEIRVQFDAPLAKGATTELEVIYNTAPTAAALQWMAAEQTTDKLKPFMYSQCQAINARSLLPCMDSPAVKFTYSAKVRAPAAIQVLMSAVIESQEVVKDGMQFTFSQKVAIPSYLLAIAAGALEKADLSHRCAVYAEPSVVKSAAWEFEATESMLATAETLMGEYVWGRYDLLVLPATFPFGGMENPCMTFVTPTLITGDRSLVNVIAHEIAHSWTGNLVTNANWQHFWLNEGNTVFVERKIVGILESQKMRDFDAHSGYEIDLKNAIYDQYSPTSPLTKLVLDDMKTTDPEDAFSTVPYEKGSALLYCIEQRIGGADRMNEYLRAYVKKFAYKTVDTPQWKAFLFEFFDKEVEEGALDSIDWEAWLTAPGMPPQRPTFDMTLVTAANSWVDEWKSATPPTTNESWTKLKTEQRIYALATLSTSDTSLDIAGLQKMQTLYNFNSTNNAEIMLPWLRLAIKQRWEVIIPTAITFAVTKGRMKFCRPIFRDLYAWETARPKAIEAFQKNRPFMHEISAGMIAKDLHLV